MKECVVFSGQGAQKQGMFLDLAEQYDVVKHVFEVAKEITGVDVLKLSEEGDMEVMSLTTNLQPMILACDIATWELCKLKGSKPDFFAGFSLGEYAALYAAGCLSLEDAFRVISVRAKAMQDAVPVGNGCMAAVLFQDEKPILEYFEKNEKQVWIANYNTKGQFSIAGEVNDFEKACEDLTNLGADVRRLAVSAPFHCKMMKPAGDAVEKMLSEIAFCDAKTPVISNYDGKASTSAEELKEKVIKQTYSAVQWIATMELMQAAGVDVYTECGPGRVLTGFAKMMGYENMDRRNVNSVKSYDKI